MYGLGVILNRSDNTQSTPNEDNSSMYTVFPHIISRQLFFFGIFKPFQIFSSLIFPLHNKNLNAVFPHIVSSLEYFPPLNSFLTSVRKLFKFLLHKGKINEETI